MTSQDPLWVSSYAPGVPAHLEYGDDTLVDHLDRAVARHGDRPAYDFLGAGADYATVGEQVERVAEGLRQLGVGPGERVALLLPSCPQNVVAFQAVLRLGATAVQHNPLYTAGELRHPFADHGARVAVVWDRVAPVVQELRGDPDSGCRVEHVVSVDLTEALPPVKRWALRLPLPRARATRRQLTGPAPGTTPFRSLTRSAPLADDHPRPTADDVALLLYTSGTTGEPKGVPLTHRNLVANVVQGRAWVPGLTEGRETFLLPLPLFHAYGLTIGVLFGIGVAAKLVLLPRPDLDLLMAAIRREVPSFLPAVPPLYQRILDEAGRRGVSLRGLRHSLSGAMPLPADLVEGWEAATGGVLVEGYGLTETAPVVVGNPMGPGRRPGSIGVPFPDVQVRLADPDDPAREVAAGERGELQVRGPQVFAGYRDRPEETARAFHEGWFRTGDIVTMDDAGFLTVADRLKEVVITGGFNVYPSEVEQVLRGHDAVADVAVVGLPAEHGSEEVVAAVVLHPGHDLDVDDLARHARAALTAYKVPRRFVRVAELPTNLIGKVLRREVAARLQEGRG